MTRSRPSDAAFKQRRASRSSWILGRIARDRGRSAHPVIPASVTHAMDAPSQPRSR